MAIKDRLRVLIANDFVRDVSKLSFGSIDGRLISLAALPILTRLYSLDGFALLAIYLGIGIGIVSAITGATRLPLEIAIPLAENDDDAAHLLALAKWRAPLKICSKQGDP